MHAHRLLADEERRGDLGVGAVRHEVGNILVSLAVNPVKAAGTAAAVGTRGDVREMREDALSAERWNRLHPTETPRTPYVTEALATAEGPVVAVTDFMKMVPDQVARWVPAPFVPLGTDGYGRSDTQANLRRHFETDAAHVVVAVLESLARADEAKPEEVVDAIARYGLDPELPDPRVR